MKKLFSFKKPKAKTAPGQLSAEKTYLQGLATIKDLIAPASFNVSPSMLRVGNRFVKTLFIIAYPRYLQTGWFSSVINLDKNV